MKKKYVTVMNCVVYTLIFSLMFVCNYLTPYIADDFAYCYSFENGERIKGIVDVIHSMLAHSKTMNGRLIAHGFMQLTTLLPTWMFDIINAVMFVLQVYLISEISAEKNRHFPWIPLTVFCTIWYFELVFAEINLWQDGSCNYLWSVVFGMLFLIPYIRELIYGEAIKNSGQKVVLYLLAIIAGAYSESVSFACIVMAVFMVVIKKFYFKEQVSNNLKIAIIVAMLGYFSIYCAPAQWINKSTEFNFRSMLNSISSAFYMYNHYKVLIIAFGVLFVLCVVEKAEKKRIILALTFILGSLAANFIMIFAKWYVERSTLGAFIFLVTADAILLQALFQSEKYKALVLCISVTVLILAIPQIAMAGPELVDTYYEIRYGEYLINKNKADGITEIELPIITKSDSKYSPAFSLKYLDTDAGGWPNTAMAKTYGVKSIKGVP